MKFLIAVYSGSAMIDFYFEDATENVAYTFEELPTAEKYTVKAFCLSDFGKLTPLCNSIVKIVH